MRQLILFFLSGLLLSAAPAQSSSSKAVFDEFLSAFNADDPDMMRTFAEQKFGDPDISYLRDVREESGGFDLENIELDDLNGFSAIVRERYGDALRRVSFSMALTDAGGLDNFQLRPLQMTREQAIANMDAFAQRMSDTDRFSGVLAMVVDGELLFEKAYGVADRETGRAVTLDTPFFYASQGKMFTATAVLQLVEQGRLKLDGTLGDYIPDYPNAEMQKVTIRQLLTHTAGTGDIALLGPEDAENRKWVRTIDDLVKLNGDRPPDFLPGSKMDYSNYGFILLGAIIEHVSGQSYYDYITAHVLVPAGMNHTSWPTLEQLDDVAVPYTSGFSGERDAALVSARDLLPWRGMPAGGGVSTAGDELLFAKALNANVLLSADTLAEATREQSKNYGYGFIVSGPANFPHWGHGGGAYGMSLALAIYPGTKMTLVCMANRDPPICDRLLFNMHFHLAPEPEK